VFVFDKNFQNPRTLNVTLAYERQLGSDLGFLLSYTHARTDHLTRFIIAMTARSGARGRLGCRRPASTGSRR